MALALVANSFYSKAQLEAYGNVIPPSPRSAEFEKFVNHKVSLSNGLPEIGINFYTIEMDNVKIPIGISYHASGIKYGQTNGDVGLGWSLTAGYRISRTVYGRVDEAYSMPDMNNVANGMAIRTYLNNNFSTPFDRDKYLARYVNPREKAYVTAVQSDYLDGQFDIFTLGLPSASGNFIISNRASQTVTMLNNSALKLNYTTGVIGIDGFTVKDQEGVGYTFGQNEANGENLQVSSKKYSTAWMISNITTPFNNTINFQYQPFQETREGMASYTRTITEGADYAYLQNGVNSCYSTKDTEQTSTASSGVYNTSLLSTITGQNETVTMTRNSNGTISIIEIRRKDNSLIKKVVFTYSQYGARVFLDSISIEGSDGISAQRYSFDYQSKATSNNYYDNFGYYQNSNLQGYMPYIGQIYLYREGCAHVIEESMMIPGSDRSTYFTSDVYCLKKITYPTGGSSSYTYEPNRYKFPGATNPVNGGGLRVSSITSEDSPGSTALRRNFYYGDADGGTLFFNTNDPNLYVKEQVTPVFRFDSSIGGSSIALLRQRTISTNLDGDLADSYVKENIGWYAQVKEDFGEGIIYHNYVMPYNGLGVSSFVNNQGYDYNWSYRTIGFPSYYVTGYHFWNKPVISEEYTYAKKTGGLLELKSKAVYNYSFPSPTGVNNEYTGLKVSAFAIASQNVGLPQSDLYQDSHLQSVFNYEPYTVTSGDVLLKSKSIYNYDGTTAGINTTTEYNYTGGNLISEEKISNSKNGLTTTKFKYPLDFEGITAADNVSAGIKQLQTANIVSPVIEKSTYVSNLDGTNSKLIQSSFTSYKTTLPLPDKIYIVEPVSALATFSPATVQSGGITKDSKYTEKLSFNQYTNKGKVLSVSKTKAGPLSYKWGYREQYPIAEIKNSAVNEFYSQNFEEPELGLDFEENVVYDNTRMHTGKYSGRIINPNATEFVSHSSKRLNISLTAPKKFSFSGWVYSSGPSVQLFLFMMKAGETGYNSYYDHMQTTVTNKWVYMKKEFLVPADVVQMFLRLDNNAAGTVWFDDLRIQPSDASMSTYTYEPLVGMTSAIDDSGKTVYYEYDTFQRLMLVKDQNGDIIKKYDYHYKP